jgi:hypothetical protein
MYTKNGAMSCGVSVAMSHCRSVQIEGLASKRQGRQRAARQRAVLRASLETGRQDDSATTRRLALCHVVASDKTKKAKRAMYQISHHRITIEKSYSDVRTLVNFLEGFILLRQGTNIFIFAYSTKEINTKTIGNLIYTRWIYSLVQIRLMFFLLLIKLSYKLTSSSK